MNALENHPFFVKWQDPTSGVVSYILDRRVAPLQKSFYFVNESLSPDKKWLWFEAAHPPAPYKCLAAVCLEPDQPDIRYFPQASMSAETGVLDSEGRIYFSLSDGSTDIWRLDVEGQMERWFTLPESFVGGRQVRRLGTHLTFTADGKGLVFDGKVGNVWYVAVVDVETRAFRLIKEFSRHYNHAQCSPVDPDLFTISQDHWKDPYTGKQNGYDLRIWLMTTDGERFEPADPTAYHGPTKQGNEVSHEWWALDGTLCWIRYQQGCYEMDQNSGKITHVWKRPVCHAHCDRTRRFWVCDQSPYFWPKPLELMFFDRKTGKETAIVSAMPDPGIPRHPWHIDPHPRFVGNDQLILYTTTVRGQVDLALVPVSGLVPDV